MERSADFTAAALLKTKTGRYSWFATTCAAWALLHSTDGCKSRLQLTAHLLTHFSRGKAAAILN